MRALVEEVRTEIGRRGRGMARSSKRHSQQKAWIESRTVFDPKPDRPPPVFALMYAPLGF